MTLFEQVKPDWTIKSGLYIVVENVKKSVMTAEKERHYILRKVANTFFIFNSVKCTNGSLIRPGMHIKESIQSVLFSYSRFPPL